MENKPAVTRFDKICEAASVALAGAVISSLFISNEVDAFYFLPAGIAAALLLYATKVIPPGFSMH